MHEILYADGRQAPDLRAEHGLPRDHQGEPQRPCRPRRLPLHRRHRLLPGVRPRAPPEAADLNLIARKIAELSLTPGIVGQDGFLTTHLIEIATLPERELVAEYLGKPDDLIDTPTPAQAMLYGPRRRRVPDAVGRRRPDDVGLGAEPGRLHAVASRRSARISSTKCNRWPTAAWTNSPNSPAAATPASEQMEGGRRRIRDLRHGQHGGAGRGRRRLSARRRARSRSAWST